MDGLLKGSCDGCTASKVKCSGGNPCERCSAKGVPCSYRPKRKRGPQKNAKSAGQTKRAAVGEDDFAFISTYEKRVWSVFFTMFKNQNRNRSESPYAWCWFAGQLDKLKDHLSKEGNLAALNRLNTWLDALDVDLVKVAGGVKKRCTFAPHQCGSCSAIAMSAPNKMGQRLSSKNLSQLQRFDLEDNSLPQLKFIVSSCKSSVNLNTKFIEEFGLEPADFESLLQWSGGGFLPWGGDLLAKLMVKESDLLVFLQILAIKFQAIGPPDHEAEGEIIRQVPSTHVFELWAKDESVNQYLMHCLHVEQIIQGEMTTSFHLKLENLGTAISSTHEEPQVDLKEMKDSNKKRAHDPVPTSDSHPPKSAPMNEHPSSFSLPDPTYDEIPAEYQSYYDSWKYYPQQENVFQPSLSEYYDGTSNDGQPIHESQDQQQMYSSHHLQQPLPPNSSESNLENVKSEEFPCPNGSATYHGQNIFSDSDGTWLNSLLEWSNSGAELTTS